MGCFYRGQLAFSCIFVWSMAIFRPTGSVIRSFNKACIIFRFRIFAFANVWTVTVAEILKFNLSECMWLAFTKRSWIELFVSDSSSITWHEPPPFASVTDTAITSATNTTLTKGSFNEELSCNFSLTADLSFKVVTFELGRVAVASYVNGKYPTVADHFVSRFNVTWVPSKLTLIVFNVTNDDKGEYRCRVQTFSGGLKTWQRIIKVDLLGKFKVN